LLEIFEPTLVVSDDVRDQEFGYEVVKSSDIESALLCSSVEELADETGQPSIAIASGGSTGQPKLILDLRTWGYRKSDIERMAPTGFGTDRTVLICGPLYHTSPFAWLHKSLMIGNRVILMKRFDTEAVLDALEHYGVSFFPTVPTVMARLLRSPTIGERDLSRLSALYHTGGPCPEWVKEGWIRLLGADKVFESYGSSENLGPTRIRGDEWMNHRGSVGVPTIPTRIVDDLGNERPVGEIGLIFQRPATWPEVKFHYLGDDDPQFTDDGYMSVGDFGYFDVDGYLYVADRRVDMIVTGGANVYPAEIEAVLLEHDDVADVVVVGVADDTWGNRVHAVVEIKPGAVWEPDTLKAFARDRMAPFKVPKDFTRVDIMPRDASGKIRRQLVRDWITSVRENIPFSD
jgi:bile acid-coenzyme A ligase